MGVRPLELWLESSSSDDEEIGQEGDMRKETGFAEAYLVFWLVKKASRCFRGKDGKDFIFSKE